MWESDWVITTLNSTVPYTDGANVAGTIFSFTFFTIIAIVIYQRFK